MHAGQRIVGVDRVIEIDRGPVCSGVACVAGGWECRGSVIRIVGSIPIRLVTSEAVSR